MKNAFEEIGTLFEFQNTGTKVVFNFGASGDLARQIEGGGPVDVFASAAQKDMHQIEKKGLIVGVTRANFAINTVVLIQSASSTLEIKGFEDLLKPEIKMVSIGNPQTVPAGKYSQEVFTHFRVWEGVSNKLVLAENVRQVLAKAFITMLKREVLDMLLTLPLVLPPTVTGYSLIILFGRSGHIGKLLYQWTGWSIMFTCGDLHQRRQRGLVKSQHDGDIPDSIVRNCAVSCKQIQQVRWF